MDVRTARPETILASMETVLGPLHLLTGELLASQELHDRMRHLATLGAEALAEAPLQETIAAVAEQVDRLVRKRQPELGAPVSLLEAARRLGISKSRTLAPAIKRDAVRTVLVGGKRKIPLDELRRLAVEGLVGPRRRAVTRPKGTPREPRDLDAEVAQVRALQYPGDA